MHKFLSLIVFAIIVVLFSCGNSGTSENKEKQEVEPQKVTINPLDTFAFNDYNSIARILAGRLPDDTLFLTQIIQSKEFKNHANIVAKNWDKHLQEINSIRDWAKIYLGNTDTVFYPFGGPDFNYMAAFFPDCKFSVLIGLEKAGKIPFSDDYSIKEYTEIFRMLNQSVVTNLNFSFFRTNSMSKDLDGYLSGTLPVILMFMSKYNFDIININPVEIDSEGYIVYTDSLNNYAHTTAKDFDNAYEIVYKLPEEVDYRRMCYFSMDLSDEEITKDSFEKMMNRYFSEQTTFLKAASYLLDRPQFLVMKELILKYSNRIVSGPSGIQYRDLDNTWDIQLFGDYIGPIRLFYDRQQNDLKEAYKNGNPTKISFKFDYHTTHHSLIIAEKKQ